MVSCHSLRHLFLPVILLQVVRLVYTNLRAICARRCTEGEKSNTVHDCIYMYLSVPSKL